MRALNHHICPVFDMDLYSVLIAKRLAEKKAKVAAIKASHKVSTIATTTTSA